MIHVLYCIHLHVLASFSFDAPNIHMFHHHHIPHLGVLECFLVKQVGLVIQLPVCIELLLTWDVLRWALPALQLPQWEETGTWSRTFLLTLQYRLSYAVQLKKFSFYGCPCLHFTEAMIPALYNIHMRARGWVTIVLLIPMLSRTLFSLNTVLLLIKVNQS